MIFNNLCFSYHTLTVMKSRRMRLKKNVAGMRKIRNAGHIFVTKYEGKITSEKPGRWWLARV